MIPFLWISRMGSTNPGDSKPEKGCPQGLRIDLLQGEVRELSGIVEMFCILIRVLISGVCTTANTYLIVHLVSVHFTLCKFHVDF